ncbi:MAG: hypothetical protein ACYCWW_20915, partial [Deltaproteobacteria bacterium]
MFPVVDGATATVAPVQVVNGTATGWLPPLSASGGRPSDALVVPLPEVVPPLVVAPVEVPVPDVVPLELLPLELLPLPRPPEVPADALPPEVVLLVGPPPAVDPPAEL